MRPRDRRARTTRLAVPRTLPPETADAVGVLFGDAARFARADHRRSVCIAAGLGRSSVSVDSVARAAGARDHRPVVVLVGSR